MTSPLRLTQYAAGGGCACKVPPGELERVLSGVAPAVGDDLLVGVENGDDAAVVRIDGDRAVITPVKTGLDSSPGVTHVGRTGYATEGKIGYLFDPALRGKDPGSFVIRAFRLP